MKINCIITDDEPLARKGLEGYIAKTGFLELTGVCEDALELGTLLKKQRADLLFLDIEMPYLTGIDFMRNTPAAPKVIFTTAYERYAIQGYELDVLDYLLKPISYERFLKAANKAYDYFSESNMGTPSYIFIKADNRLEKLSFDEILFVEAMENYIGVYTREKKFITHSTLKAFQEKLPAGRFIQPHKSYLVQVDAIRAIEANILYIGDYQVPVSKYLKEEVMERIVNNKLLKK